MDAPTFAAAGSGRAVRFTGDWREFLPIAATNALLIIVTLGIYRFWATARQRRYLWSHTHVIDDSLEWTGTGKEMFVGFLIVLAILIPFFLFIQFLFPALIARGKEGAAMGVFTLFYIALLYLGGFARFRALRYRLSRTWWHGIRGGSDNPGWNYGGEWLGRYALVGMTMFIMFPWAATRLWNSRWNAMSFGPLQFSADLTSEGLKRRWAALYLVPIAVLIVVSLLIAVAFGSAIDASGGLSPTVGGVIFGMVAASAMARHPGQRRQLVDVRRDRPRVWRQAGRQAQGGRFPMETDEGARALGADRQREGLVSGSPMPIFHPPTLWNPTFFEAHPVTAPG